MLDFFKSFFDSDEEMDYDFLKFVHKNLENWKTIDSGRNNIHIKHTSKDIEINAWTGSNPVIQYIRIDGKDVLDDIPLNDEKKIFTSVKEWKRKRSHRGIQKRNLNLNDSLRRNR